MSLVINKNRDIKPFNMTAIIDIVFLLIIFFVVTYQFMDTENLPVNIPDECGYAKEPEDSEQGMVTVTVIQQTQDKVLFAVAGEVVNVSADEKPDIQMTRLIDVNLDRMADADRTVVLRIDRDVCFRDAQHALSAIAESSAVNIKLAAFKGKRP